MARSVMRVVLMPTVRSWRSRSLSCAAVKRPPCQASWSTSIASPLSRPRKSMRMRRPLGRVTGTWRSGRGTPRRSNARSKVSSRSDPTGFSHTGRPCTTRTNRALPRRPGTASRRPIASSVGIVHRRRSSRCSTADSSCSSVSTAARSNAVRGGLVRTIPSSRLTRSVGSRSTHRWSTAPGKPDSCGQARAGGPDDRGRASARVMPPGARVRHRRMRRRGSGDGESLLVGSRGTGRDDDAPCGPKQRADVDESLELSATHAERAHRVDVGHAVVAGEPGRGGGVEGGHEHPLRAKAEEGRWREGNRRLGIR